MPATDPLFDRRRIGSALGLSAALLAAPAVATATAASGSGGPFDAARVSWNALRFHAAKLFLSATAEVRVELLDRDRAVPELTAAPDGSGRLPRGSQVVLLTVHSKLAGRETVERLWLDPVDGAALERRKEQRGGNPYVRSERYTSAGVHRLRRAPAGRREARKDPKRWSDRQVGFQPFGRPGGQPPATHALALFYLVSAAPLEAPGDRVETAIFARGRTIPVTLEVVGSEAVAVAFDELQAGRTEARRGAVQALRVRVSDGGAEGDDVRLLGLKRDIEILIEAASRLPLVVRGSVSVLGRVDVALTRAERR